MTQQPLRVFIGTDHRQELAFTVAAHSVSARASEPVSITALRLSQLPVTVRGLTDFTYTRFLVPWLCGFEGHALFMDADQIVTDDIAELFGLFAGREDFDVAVMQEQPPFEWPSVMLFNCAAPACRQLTPEFINDVQSPLMSLKWAERIAPMPEEWNVCVGYRDLSSADVQAAKLLHYTVGIPIWPETNVEPIADEPWHAAYGEAIESVAWRELMGASVHQQATIARMLRLQHGIILKQATTDEPKLVLPR